jgi:PAS domain S-box-containing protein
MAHDVTEKVKTQKALRESTARLQALVNSIDQIAFEFDVDGTFLDIWTTNESLLFRPRSELLGRRVSDVMGENSGSLYESIFKRVLESGAGEDLEYSLPLASGERWFLGRITPIFAPDGTYKSICMLARDITDRKQTEKSLVLFRTLMDRSNDAIEVVDPVTLRFLDVNQKACSDLGYSREEILQMNVYGVNPTLDSATHARVTEALEQSGSFIKESIRRRKDGSTFPVEENINLVQLDKSYLVSMIRDITERKLAESQVRQLSGLLLKAQDEERRVVAREVHDGIGSYVGGLSIALTKIRTCLDETNYEHAEVIAECRELLQAVGTEIRTISYLLHPPTLELLGLESALTWLVSGFSDTSGIKTSSKIAPNLGRFKPEVELTLFRVTQEALNNVYRHSGSKTATVDLFRDSRNVVLEVADWGKGMKPHLLEPTRPLTVGISGMRERVENLRGTFSIESAPGQGCVVRVSAPLEQ